MSCEDHYIAGESACKMPSLRSPALGGLLPDSVRQPCGLGAGIRRRRGPALAKLKGGKTEKAKRESAQSAQVGERYRNAEVPSSAPRCQKSLYITWQEGRVDLGIVKTPTKLIWSLPCISEAILSKNGR